MEVEVEVNISMVSLTCAGGHKVGTTVNSADLQQLRQIFLRRLKDGSSAPELCHGEQDN